MDLNRNVDQSIVKLSDFSRALALPVRIYIIRQILDNQNYATREMLYNIPFKKNLIDTHILELKNMGLLKADPQNKTHAYMVDENRFIAMYNGFLNLFMPIGRWNDNLIGFINRPTIRARKQRKAVEAGFIADRYSFGKYVKQQRRSAGLTQTQLGDHIDICRRQLGKIESGEILLKPEKIKPLAALLKVSFDDLMDRYYQSSKYMIIDRSGLE